MGDLAGVQSKGRDLYKVSGGQFQEQNCEQRQREEWTLTLFSLGRNSDDSQLEDKGKVEQWEQH